MFFLLIVFNLLSFYLAAFNNFFVKKKNISANQNYLFIFVVEISLIILINI